MKFSQVAFQCFFGRKLDALAKYKKEEKNFVYLKKRSSI